MEIQRSHLRGYKNCISQTSSFSALEHCVSKQKIRFLYYVKSNIFHQEGNFSVLNKEQ